MSTVSAAGAAVLTLPTATVLPSRMQSLSGAAPEPRETFMGTVGRNILTSAVETGDMVGKGVGGFVGLSSVGLGLYAGLAGGALFLGFVGGGLGPVVAAASTQGLANFVVTSFRTMTTAARIGTIMGGTACAVGGAKVGYLFGKAAGTVPGWIIGAPIGAAKGVNEALHNKMDGPEDGAAAQAQQPAQAPAPQAPAAKLAAVAAAAGSPKKGKDSKLGTAMDVALSGVGLGSGLIGGGMIGAGVASGTTLITGLMASNVTWGALTAAGFTGAVVGGVAMGAAGLIGGAQISRWIRGGVGWVYNKTIQGRKLVELEKKEAALNQKEAEIKALGLEVDKKTTDLKAYFDRKNTEIDAKVAELNQRETVLADRETRTEQIIEERAQKRYDEKSADLKDWETRLTREDRALDLRDAELARKEKEFDVRVEAKATEKYNARKGQLEGEYRDRTQRLESEYQTRGAALDRRQDGLDTREANLNQEVQRKVDAELRPLRDELDRRIDSARRNEETTDRYRREAEVDRQAAQSIRYDAERIRSEADRERRDAVEEKERFQRANADVQRERSMVEMEKQRLLQKEAELNRWEEDLRRRSGGQRF